MIAKTDRYEAMLSGLARKNRLRSLSLPLAHDFSSNDYLGLASSQRLADALALSLAQGIPVGAGGSRLLRGNHPAHEELEAIAATFFKTERALFFGSGYIANFSVLTTLPQKGDLLILDENVHASVHEGARAGRAEVVETYHNDVNAIEDAIASWRLKKAGAGQIWIAVESLYSMDGDFAPLAQLVALANKHDAFLFIDEAHATGVYGPDGRGLAADFEGYENIITLHTCGKALGSSGALITASKRLCDYLINRCRPFIYATAPSPLMAVAVKEALAILKQEPERRTRLAQLIAFTNHELTARCGFAPTHSQILPIIIGDNRSTVKIANALQAHGFDIRAIRPPTVREGTARLRLSLTLNIDEQIICSMLDSLIQELRRKI